MPKRIQRKRTKGWTMPANTIYVGRPAFWRNMFPVGEPDQIGGKYIAKDNAEAVQLFNDFIDGKTEYGEFNKDAFVKIARYELFDKNLACWCPLDQPCHADTLLELANGE